MTPDPVTGMGEAREDSGLAALLLEAAELLTGVPGVIPEYDAMAARLRAAADNPAPEPARDAAHYRDMLAKVFADHDAIGCCDPRTTEHVWQSIEFVLGSPATTETTE